MQLAAIEYYDVLKKSRYERKGTVGGRKVIRCVIEKKKVENKQLTVKTVYCGLCRPHWQSAKVLALRLQTMVACSSGLPK
jgi:hypothetical protein